LTRNRPEMEIRYVAPRDEIERALVDIWQDLLDMTPVGVLDDVFALGCDSLVVVRFVQRVKSGLGIDIEVSGVFKGPTVAAMATMIAQRPDRVS